MAATDRYVIVIPSLTLGGAERQALNYAVSIRSLNIGDPIVIGLGRVGELATALDDAGIEHRHIPMSAFASGSRFGKLLTLIGWAWKLILLRPHTVIGFTYWPNVFCGMVWRFTGAKRMIWNQRSVDSGLPITLWERLAIMMRPMYMSNGMAGAMFIAERHGLRLAEVKVVPNVLKLNHTPKAHDSKEPIRLVMTANFYPEKDHATVLRALALYLSQDDRLSVHLHLIGIAPGRSTLMAEAKALAFDLGLCGNVTFHGTVRDVASHLANANVGILSTRSEGVSNAILEYMAHGLPVIATDILANREALGEHNSKWLFPVEDIGRCTELLTALIASTDREYIGAANRAYVALRHSEDEFEKHLNEVLG
jgi:glycosyltransferase involved in cell wall biosynthesis